MSDETQWYVMQEDQQLGPYTGEQLVSFASEGNITRESLIWAEGMENWLPAGEVEGVFPAQQAAAPVLQVGAAPAQAAHNPLMTGAVQQAQPAGNPLMMGGATQQPQAQAVQASANPMNPYGAPAAAGGMLGQPALDPEGPYPSPGVKPASFGLWLGMLLGGLALVLIGVVLTFVVASSVAATEIQAMNEGVEVPASSEPVVGGFFVGLLVFGGTLITGLSTIPMYITIFRAWKCIQPGGLARSTPGKAIGFLFIPFFNLYWIFQAFKGLAEDWNRTIDTYADIKSAPRLSEGVFLTFCIGTFLPPLNSIMLFPVMSQMCRGINFFAFRPTHNMGGSATASAGFTLR